jgi:hypothetical protein
VNARDGALLVLAFGVGLAIGARALRAADSSCCERLSYGARDKIASYAGPLAGLVAGGLDATGLTKLLPGALDLFGVPKDA